MVAHTQKKTTHIPTSSTSFFLSFFSISPRNIQLKEQASHEFQTKITNATYEQFGDFLALTFSYA